MKESSRSCRSSRVGTQSDPDNSSELEGSCWGCRRASLAATLGLRRLGSETGEAVLFLLGPGTGLDGEAFLPAVLIRLLPRPTTRLGPGKTGSSSRLDGKPTLDAGIDRGTETFSSSGSSGSESVMSTERLTNTRTCASRDVCLSDGVRRASGIALGATGAATAGPGAATAGPRTRGGDGEGESTTAFASL